MSAPCGRDAGLCTKATCRVGIPALRLWEQGSCVFGQRFFQQILRTVAAESSSLALSVDPGVIEQLARRNVEYAYLHANLVG